LLQQFDSTRRNVIRFHVADGSSLCGLICRIRHFLNKVNALAGRLGDREY